MPRSLEIGVDLDGVAHDFIEGVRHFAVNHKGMPAERFIRGGCDDPDTTWDFHQTLWGLSFEEFVDLCAEGVDAGVVFNYGEPFEGAIETLQSLHEAGHRIHLVTNRSWGTKVHHNTSDWLTKWGVPYDSLVFTANKTIVRPDIFLDDYERNFNALWGAGIECWLFDRPWNRHVSTNFRVHSWDAFNKVVQAKAEEG